MSRLIVTPRAERDVAEAIANLNLPRDTWTWARIGRALRLLEDFPLAGRELGGVWTGARFLLGPWPWMILVYSYDEPADTVFVVAVNDARAATSPAAGRT